MRKAARISFNEKAFMTATSPRLLLVQQTLAGVSATNSCYSPLFRPGVSTQPILYFGDPLMAEYATFGVNPSAAEFGKGRWPQSPMTAHQLEPRLVGYFQNTAVSAHSWFKGYETCLNMFGHSYRTNAVHLDLSPRATVAMRSADPNLFLQMIAADMQWFLSALALCGRLKAAIMAGSVTNKFYFDEFLKAYLPPTHSLKLRTRFGSGRRGATALYDLTGPGLNVPVFFCGTSPSGDKGVRLAGEMQRNLTALKAVGF